MPNDERFKPYAAVYLVLVKDGQVLLSKRCNTGYQDGNYSLVAGHLDGGETTKQGIIREAKEEANVTINPSDLEVIHVMHRFRPDREYIDFYLKAEKWLGDIKNLEPNKCSELKWYNLNNLPENMAPEVRLALENLNKNIFFSELGWEI